MNDFGINLFAQQIVDSTSCFLKTRTINIMNTKGVIIASNDHSRIGSIHEGAIEAIKTGLPVELTVDKLSSYKGAKEGINTPIVKDGKLIGVIGIYGNPDDIRDTAKILSVCVGLYLDQMQEMGRNAFKQAAAQNILDRIISPLSDDPFTSISETASNIGYSLELPSVMIVIHTTFQERITLSTIHRKLIEKKLISEKKDLLGTNVTGYVILKSLPEDKNIDNNFLNNIHELFLQLGFSSIKIGAGKKAFYWDELHSSYKDALSLTASGNKNCYDANTPEDAAILLLKSTSKEAIKRFTPEIQKQINDDSNPWKKETIQKWLSCSGNILQTAEELNIHKNTCLYRLKKIDEECGLEKASAFIKMYLYSLVIQGDDY